MRIDTRNVWEVQKEVRRLGSKIHYLEDMLLRSKDFNRQNALSKDFNRQNALSRDLMELRKQKQKLEWILREKGF